MSSREELRRQVLESLDQLDDHQLELMARVMRLDHSRRWGNPPFLLGLGSLEASDGGVRGEVEIRDVHRAPHGAAHGMIPFGLLDNAMGTSVAMRVPAIWVALEIKLQFVRPLLPGPAVVEAEPMHIGRRIAATGGRVLSGGDVAVLGTGTYYLTGRQLDERR